MRRKNYWPFGGFEPGGAADEVTDGPTDKVVAGIDVGVPLTVGVVILFYPFESICEKYLDLYKDYDSTFYSPSQIFPFSDFSFLSKNCCFKLRLLTFRIRPLCTTKSAVSAWNKNQSSCLLKECNNLSNGLYV